jgi:sialate O-acetylesterase
MKKWASFLFTAVFIFLFLGQVTPARAGRPSNNLTVSPYFTSHMVLQQGENVPVFGTATAATLVTATYTVDGYAPITASDFAEADGKWRVNLPSLSASTQAGTLVVSGGGNSFTFTDVLVGEVWILSGQSNINLPLWQCIGGTGAVTNEDQYRNIRLYMSKLSGVGTSGTWLECKPANARYWSGVGFFFARALQQTQDPVPVGLIQVAKNGSPIADWTTFSGNRGRFYVANIIPIQPMAIRGVIWYQGETEADPYAYYRMLPGLIGNWRADWKQGNFPFYIVQLAPISGRDTYPVIRDAQVSAIDEDNNIEMACIIDIDTVPTTEIHPPDKKPVGDRLALIARANLYGETGLPFSGPIRDLNPAVTRILGSSIVVGFRHAEGGLVTEDGVLPGPFEIAGPDRVYYPATAHFAGPDAIEASSLSVTHPESVRYGWAAYPQCNLLNGARLPASPFGITFTSATQGR